MKFMKLGSKSDQFQTEGDNIRYVAADLATDMVISIGDVKFYVHKFPLLSKSSRLQKLIVANEDDSDEINIDDIPGGPAAFEICAKFCYGMAVTLNAFNLLAARCAAEYLEMYETVEKGNFVYKIDIFLTSSIFRTWKDSITVLQTAKSFLPWSEELKVVSHCIDAIATRASTDLSRVDWPYTYNRKKLPSENGDEPHWSSGRKQQMVPKDWWVEDLCDLPIDLYKKVITTIKAKGRLPAAVIGEALKAYAARRLPSIRKGTVQSDCLKYRHIVDTIIHLIPTEKGSIPCSFLLRLMLASIVFECGEMGRRELVWKIAQQLEEATVADFLIHSPAGGTTTYDIDLVHAVVEQYVMRERCARIGCPDDLEFQDMYRAFDSDASKSKVARLVDGYLAEASRDPSLPLPKFVALAEMVSSFPRSSHDGIYRAIDTFLKEHPVLTKSEKKRICRLMDCRRLSPDACAHVVRNERLPLRTVVQVLFFEQARTAAGATGSVKGSCRSSRSATATTNSDDDWDVNQTSEELKGELPRVRRIDKGSTGAGAGVPDAKSGTPKRVKKMLLRLWSNGSSSDMSESPGSAANVARRLAAPSQTLKKVAVRK